MSIKVESLSRQLKHIMRADFYPFYRRLQNLKRKNAADIQPALEPLQADIQASRERRQQRKRQCPQPEFPEELPVSMQREVIAQTIREHQVVVVAGETGSGKTTQLPKICLLAGRGEAGLIGCTQPRRIAARSIANRVAGELNTEVGHAVGFQVRFQDRTHPDAYIKLMTDGILLAETQNDPFLNAYDTLIIDEAHERSLNIDFLLGYLKQLLPKRRDLKLIITSATIDTARFSEHFDNAPVVEVSGRAYPVEVQYQPLSDADEADSRDLQQGILEATDTIARSPYDGDILIFLSGERDIRETAEALRKHHPPHTEVLPLYARLSASEQDRVFKPGKNRRIVLATNVAETSLTVPRIRAVIDPGLARISRYSTRSKVQRLQIEKISQASADQRKGRCGRIAPGLCIRLYSPDDYASRTEFTLPELLRTSLSAVILRMLDLRIKDVEQFPFLEPPERKAMNDGFKQLEELGAIHTRNGIRSLNPLGRQLAKLPIDPRIGRMILAAKDFGCVAEVLIIAAALSVQDPRERPLEAQQAADQAQDIFKDERSDFLSFLKLWDFYHENARHLSNSKLRKLCQAHFLSYLRLREWSDVHQQLFAQVREMGWEVSTRVTHPEPLEKNLQAAEKENKENYEGIHRALLTGLLSNIATLDEDSQYLGARGIKWHIFPGSGLFKKKPKWIMASELVDTTRLYARCVAKIEPEWVEQAAGDLCRRQYFEPHWEKKRAQVAAFERVTVYGLTVIGKRKINYGPLFPVESREIFIREALVNGVFHTHLKFFQHNKTLLDEIENLEHKARKHDILVDDERIFKFYDSLVPEGIYNGAQFEKWYKKQARQDDTLLHLERDYLMDREAEELTEQAFPPALLVNNLDLPLHYHFDPNADDDGVSVDIPVEAVNQLSPAAFEWLVPGLLEEKITGLLRSLPKSIRKHFVPIPDFAKDARQALDDFKTLSLGTEEHADSVSPDLHSDTPPARQPPSAKPKKQAVNDLKALGDLFKAVAEPPAPAPKQHPTSAPSPATSPATVPTDSAQPAYKYRVAPPKNALSRALADYLFRRTGTPIAQDAWQLDSLSAHLFMNFRLLDERGEVLDASRSLTHLQEQWREQSHAQFKRLPKDSWERAHITRWDFGDMPDDIKLDSRGVTLLAYPALVDCQQEVALQLFDNPQQAERKHRAGLRRLALLMLATTFKQVIKKMPVTQTMCLQYMPVAPCSELKEDVLWMALDNALLFNPVPRRRAEFDARLEDIKQRLFQDTQKQAQILEQVLEVYHRVSTQLEPGSTLENLYVLRDIRAHLDHLIYPGFLRDTPVDALQHFPRYLKAIEKRLERMAQSPSRDAQREAEITTLWEAYLERYQQAEEELAPEFKSFRWLLEELRVSLFAQELRTAHPVSVARLEKKWATLLGR